MALAELSIADGIKSRISAAVLQDVAANLHKRDCQVCGEPIGYRVPALGIDDFGPLLVAETSHDGCRPSGWYPLQRVTLRTHMSWTSRFLTLPRDDESGNEARATFLVCPHMEAVHLDRDIGNEWTVNT